ncbi:MAG: PRC-barrel domain-containing protein [Verrucomicrobia bacterium]|nr:PRC-barrel domain-containing protein [Verrucomicrobiota bacterium]
MKRTLQILLSASASSILALSMLAQDTSIPKTEGPSYTRERAPHAQRAHRLNGAAKASDLIGMEVKNYQDEKLGKVEDLALDVESGRIVQVILSTGGFIGIGDRLTAVPPGALHHDIAQKVLHLDASIEKLKSAPEFEMSKWAESSDSERMSAVYRYYGQESAFTFIQRDEATDNQLLNTEGQRNTDGQRYSRTDQRNADDQRYTHEGQRTADGSPNTVSTRRADGTWDKDRIPAESGNSQFLIPASRLSQIQKASKLIGTSVTNLQDEKLGDVENLLVDLSSGRIVALIVSTGGFLGMDDELSAVPSSALRYTTDRDSLQLDASKEMLSSAPHFKANQWPDFNQPGYASDVYRAYNVQPYFSTDEATDEDNSRRNVRDRDERTPATWQPDNTERNIRDRDDQTLTPFNQGTSKSEARSLGQPK